MGRKARRRGSISPRGKDRWLIRISAGTDGCGRQVRLGKVVRGTKADADRRLTELLKRADDGLPAAYTAQRLGDWIEEWLLSWRSNASPRTREDYRRVFGRYLPPELMSRRLPNLTPTDVQTLVNTLTADGLSPRTVRILHGALRACLNTALRLGKVPRNVATLVELPAKTHREMRCFTAEEAQRFLELAESEQRAVDNTEPARVCFYPLFAVLLLGGLRPGEALALRWSDLDGNALRVQRAVTVGADNKKVIAGTKTRRSRVVPSVPGDHARDDPA